MSDVDGAGQPVADERSAGELVKLAAEQLRQEIEQTREQLGETAEQLAAKADVKRRSRDKAAALAGARWPRRPPC